MKLFKSFMTGTQIILSMKLDLLFLFAIVNCVFIFVSSLITRETYNHRPYFLPYLKKFQSHNSPQSDCITLKAKRLENSAKLINSTDSHVAHDSLVPIGHHRIFFLEEIYWFVLSPLILRITIKYINLNASYFIGNLSRPI